MIDEIRTDRMVLRWLRRRDRDEFVRAHAVSRDAFERWTPMEPGQNLNRLFEHELARCQGARIRGTHVRLAGFLEDGRIAGFFALNDIVQGVFENAYAGWSTSSDATGRGLCTEGVRALLDLAFSRPPAGLGLHRVQANIIPGNAASLRVAEKAGFRREGLALRYLRIGGQWQDHVTFAKLAEEHVGEGAVDRAGVAMQ